MTPIPADKPVELTDEQPRGRALKWRRDGDLLYVLRDDGEYYVTSWVREGAYRVATEKIAENMLRALSISPQSTSDEDEEAESPIAPGWSYTVGDGHDGFGCYAHSIEYPEEGAVKIASGRAPEVTRESREVELRVWRLVHRDEDGVSSEQLVTYEPKPEFFHPTSWSWTEYALVPVADRATRSTASSAEAAESHETWCVRQCDRLLADLRWNTMNLFDQGARAALTIFRDQCAEAAKLTTAPHTADESRVDGGATCRTGG